MFSLRVHLWILLLLLATMILLIVVGNMLVGTGIGAMLATHPLPVKILFFGLVVALAFAFMPVMVKLVVGFQIRAGNAGLSAVKAAVAHETHIVWGLWLLMAAGIAVGLPAAIKDGFFGSPSSAAAELGPALGVLVAAPGMDVADMLAQSSLKPEGGGKANVPFAGGGDFDFRVAGTDTLFRHCRYYFVSMETHNPERIEGLSIGTAPRKLTRAELDAANAAMQRQLQAEGWRAGHEVYKTAENLRLHGGATQGPSGWIWLKSGIILRIETRRMDDPAAGEDAATSGEWIQFIELWSASGYAGIELLEFTPP
jgi:hypothetical protein